MNVPDCTIPDLYIFLFTKKRKRKIRLLIGTNYGFNNEFGKQVFCCKRSNVPRLAKARSTPRTGSLT